MVETDLKFSIKLIEIERIEEKPAIKAEFEVKGEYLALLIEKGVKDYVLNFITNDGKRIKISINDYEEPPARRISRELKLLGFELKEDEVKQLFFEIYNDEKSKWLETWQPPHKDEAEDKELERKARELLNDPFILQKIRQVTDFEIAGMGRKKLSMHVIFLSKNLINTNERISAVPHGKWGEGKSILVEKVLTFHDYIRMNSATLASVYRDSLKNPWYYDRKILYFGDLGDEIPDDLKDVIELFKELATEGEVVRKIVIDEKVVELKLKGTPILTWTAQTPPEDLQILSRTLPISIDFSEKQRRLVQEFSNYEKELPVEVLCPNEVKELKKIIKKAFKILEKEVLPTLNPYARLINDCMSIHSPNVNRDRNKFFGLVSAITHLYQFQRAKITINGQDYVVSHPIDVLYALYLMADEFEVLFGELDQFSQRAYEIIKTKIEPIQASLTELLAQSGDFEDREARKEAIKELTTKAFTNDDLAEWLNIHVKTARRLTLNLYRKGLIDRLKEGKAWKYYLLPQYKKQAKVNGVTLFDTRSMIEGLVSGKELEEWLNRYEFQMPQEWVCKYIIKIDDLKNISTPDARISNIPHPFWDNLETMLFKPPQTFDFLLENGFELRVRKSTLAQSSENGDIADEDKNREDEIQEIEGELIDLTKIKECPCGYTTFSGAEYQKHIEDCPTYQFLQKKRGENDT